MGLFLLVGKWSVHLSQWFVPVGLAQAFLSIARIEKPAWLDLLKTGGLNYFFLKF
jgi:hypothetical protein